MKYLLRFLGLSVRSANLSQPALKVIVRCPALLNRIACKRSTLVVDRFGLR